MKIFDIFKSKSSPVSIDKEIVSQIDTSTLFTLDGLKYNPDSISLDVYKKISRHYQAKAAIATISYSIQQIEWFIQSDNEQVQRVVQYAVEKIWNNLIRSVSKAFKYGYSPNVKVFTLEEIDGKDYIIYKKIKDLNPAYCKVNLDKYGNFDGFYYNTGKLVPGADAIKGQFVKSEYAFWYTSEMENGNQYGESSLKSAYKPWWFSEKMHVFCNRYYERFGEPLVIGRAPSSSYVQDPSTGKKLSAQEAMSQVISSIRSHSSAQMPSDQDEKGNYVYDLKYLESQMRGFDFGSYLDRLDREIALGLLFPTLFLGGEKGGSYSLGSAQIQGFYTNLMGMMDNVVDYVDSYIIPQIVLYNFPGKNSAKMSYQPLSVDAKKNIQEMLMATIKTNRYELNREQLEKRSGIKLEKVEASSSPKKSTVVEPAKNPKSKV